jgi:hypothetical protein
MSDMWEEKNPVEEGEVVTWCEFSNHPSRDDCSVIFSESAAAESSMKLRILNRRPQRQLRRESKQQSSAPANQGGQLVESNLQRPGVLNKRNSSIISIPGASMCLISSLQPPPPPQVGDR